ncbi:MAG: Twitching mobility protein [Syntrophomonadaceae bacterium]|nr:Twitching mobility protein [Bacillota bacterium]
MRENEIDSNELDVERLGWFGEALKALKHRNGVTVTDIFVVEGKPVRAGVLKACIPIEPLIIPKKNGINKFIEDTLPAELGAEKYNELFSASQEAVSKLKRVERESYIEYAFSVKGFGRFRVSFSVSDEGVGLAIRQLPYDIPQIERLDKFGWFKGIKKMLNASSFPAGLILHTGTTGSGKTTLIASEIDYIAAKTSGVIYTFENPIEYKYTGRKAFIRQYEIGRHINSFIDGIRMSLRNNLTALLIGEIRSKEEIYSLFDAAMRGCLVFSSVHTANVMTTLRFLDGAGGENRDAWRQIIASAVRAIVSQKLIYKKEHGFIIIPEIFIPNGVIKQKIIEGKFSELEKMWDDNTFKEQTDCIRFKDSVEELFSKNILTLREKEEHLF